MKKVKSLHIDHLALHKSAKDAEDMVKQICDYMGEDLDSPACREVQEHLEACPTCKVYFDTVRKTVTLCRQCEQEESIPADVKSRLFKVLHLDQIQNRHNRT
jgi:predicted anti-sigma-YlaC factor YlaD